MNPWKTPDADVGDLRLPMVVVCHCNDCRRATASVLPHVLALDITTVTVSVTSLTGPDDGGAGSKTSDQDE